MQKFQNTKNNHIDKKQDERILEIEAEQYYQLQAEIEQLKQEKKSCFSLTDIALVALGVSFF